ncbi:unnamed protein product [Citrullus colocynthis]|uniref:Secreted protein n=1 Tax=Citrullus colocynthis TaxID=252529 RepID=A0ABP0XTX3_9ROSI
MFLTGVVLFWSRAAISKCCFQNLVGSFYQLSSDKWDEMHYKAKGNTYGPQVFASWTVAKLGMPHICFGVRQQLVTFTTSGPSN